MGNIYDLETPVVLVDLDRLEANISEMARIAERGGKGLRPHIKSHKCAEIARLQRSAGAIGLTVAKLDEALVLAGLNLENGSWGHPVFADLDLFIANEIVSEEKVYGLLALMDRVRVTVGVDSVEGASALSRVALRAGGSRIPVRMEIDTGHRRAGVQTWEEARTLAHEIGDLAGIELCGLFTHEGHTYSAVNDGGRRDVVATAAAQMRSFAEGLRAEGFAIDAISMGSTPGARFVADETDVTEMRPGNYVFLDRMQVEMDASEESCALTVLATVISRRPDGRLLLDCGTKTLASDRPFADGTFGKILDHPELVFFGASEEHGNVRIEGECRLKVGDRVRVLPNHACTCVNMHSTLTAYRGEHVETVWAVAARGCVR